MRQYKEDLSADLFKERLLRHDFPYLWTLTLDIIAALELNSIKKKNHRQCGRLIIRKGLCPQFLEGPFLACCLPTTSGIFTIRSKELCVAMISVIEGIFLNV